MKQEITKCQFHDAFRDHGRQDQFSYDGLNALYEYLDDLEESCGIEVELDVIAFCCEYTEYEDLNEFNCNYDNNWNLEDIQENTTVIMVNDESFIIQDF